MRELIALWERILGTSPVDEQFEIWLAMHTPEVVRLGIVKTAAKNMSLGQTMDSDHKIRFASKVMLTQTHQREQNAANRERLDEDFGRRIDH